VLLSVVQELHKKNLKIKIYISLSRLLYTHYFTLWELQFHVSHDIFLLSSAGFCYAKNFPFWKFLSGERSCEFSGTQQGSACYSSSIWTSRSGNYEVLRSDHMPLSYSMFVRKRLTTKHGMLKLRNFVKWKNQNSPLNGCEFHTALFRELRNLLRCNSVTISESQAFSTLKLSPKETSLANWYHAQDPKICQYYVSIESNYRNRLTFLNKHRVLSGHLDASFSPNCQSFYQKIQL